MPPQNAERLTMIKSGEENSFVALKIHLRKYAHDGKREYAVTCEIRHRGLPSEQVALPGDAFDTNDGIICLAYPLYGRDLTHWIEDQHRPFSPAEAREITRKSLEFFGAFHSIGAAHTDIKPENLLYDSETGEFKIIDFGNSERRFKRGTPVATREYTPPEGIIGGELSPGVDIWSMACTLFQLLTGELLFDPHQVAGEKYVEFSDDDEEDEEEDIEEEEDAGEADEEEGEFKIGDLVGGKYRLIAELGCGNFATVWKARLENPHLKLPQLGELDAKAESPAQKQKKSRKPGGKQAPTPVRPQKAREARRHNRRQFGVTDAYDLALNYEHLLLMQRLLGPFPRELAKDGIYHRIYFTVGGILKYDPDPEKWPPAVSIARRLANCGISEREAGEIEAFLLPMLRFRISDRATASECLLHRWMNS